MRMFLDSWKTSDQLADCAHINGAHLPARPALLCGISEGHTHGKH